MIPAAFYFAFALSQSLFEKESRIEKANCICAHIVTGDDAEVGDAGVHLLPDDGEARDTLPDTV